LGDAVQLDIPESESPYISAPVDGIDIDDMDVIIGG